MHARIRDRRVRVGESLCAEESPKDLAGMLRLMNAIEARVLGIAATGVDQRLPGLIATMKSVRLIIEMSSQSSETATHLMPCANAALLHVRSEMMLVARELGDRARHADGLSRLRITPAPVSNRTI
jgi:hypothetical protein